MLIAVNTRMLLKDKMEGIGYFSSETLKRITQNHPEHRFLFIFDRPYSEEFVFNGNVMPVVAFPPARHPILWYWWYEFSVTAVLKKHKADIFLSPDGYLSLRSSIPSLAVIHDINFRHYPGDLPFLFRTYYNYFFPKYASHAARIATVSEFSKKDIAVNYGISPARIDVVYNGASENYRPASEADKKNSLLKFSDGHPYFLFVSSLHKRKNIVNLLKAFEQFKSSADSPVKLVFAGSRRWWSSEMEETCQSMKFKDQVIFKGRLSDADLQECTAAAFASVYVSNFEGFGIPIVEAMQCGVPVITSNISAMPEIAGNAALLVDPFSVSSIADGMMRIFKDEALRKNIGEAGRKRAENFSWDKTSSLLWESIMKISYT